MKISKEHYAHIFKAIESIGAAKIQSHRNFLVIEGKAKDIEKRLRWDLSYAAGLTTFFCDEVYKYADDSHIDTALKAVMKQLNV